MTRSTSLVAVCCSSAQQIAIAILQLLKESRVLDGDDSLVSERLEQGDLLVRERLDPRPPDA